MDTHDVSDTPQSLGLLRRQQLKLREAQALQGQPLPTPRPPRDQVILDFKSSQMDSSPLEMADNTGTRMRTSHVPPAYLPSVEPLAALNKLMISDLRVETHHRGGYLVVRCVTGERRMTGVIAVVEDERGEVLVVQLYHRGEVNGKEKVLVEGGVMVLKEPYLKMMSDGTCGLRVDHLGDVLFLEGDDGRVPGCWRRDVLVGDGDGDGGALEWRVKGDERFNRGEYRGAVKCYTRALGCSPTEEEMRTARLNRASAFYNIGQFDAALADVEATETENDKPAEKALFCKAGALFKLRRDRECCEVLKVLRLEYPDNGPAKIQLPRAVARLAEQTNGVYNFKKILAEAGKIQPPNMNHATYIGPVRVQSSGSRGRGLFTTEAVKAGDLLFCEKAFTYASVDKGGGGLTILIDTDGDRVTVGAQSNLIDMTVQKLYNNPSLMSAITDLHHGAYQPVTHTQVDNQPIVDTFLISRIVSLNSFGCPTTSTHDHQKDLRTARAQAPNSSEERDLPGFHSCGIWPTASYINHSCTSNGRRSFIGDLMIARATKDLPAGSEITWWYFMPTTADSNKQHGKKGKSKAESNHWGFTCSCPLCEDECATTSATRQKRRRLAEGLERCLSSSGSYDAVMGKIETVVEAMNGTYARPAKVVPRLAVWEVVQRGLTTVLGWGPETRSGMGEQVRMMGVIQMALEALGYVFGFRGEGRGRRLVVKEWGLLEDGVVDLWVLLRDVYPAAGGGVREIVRDVEEYAKTAYRMVYGEDETFEGYGEN